MIVSVRATFVDLKAGALRDEREESEAQGATCLPKPTPMRSRNPIKETTGTPFVPSFDNTGRLYKPH